MCYSPQSNQVLRHEQHDEYKDMSFGIAISAQVQLAHKSASWRAQRISFLMNSLLVAVVSIGAALFLKGCGGGTTTTTAPDCSETVEMANPVTGKPGASGKVTVKDIDSDCCVKAEAAIAAHAVTDCVIGKTETADISIEGGSCSGDVCMGFLRPGFEGTMKVYGLNSACCSFLVTGHPLTEDAHRRSTALSYHKPSRNRLAVSAYKI